MKRFVASVVLAALLMPVLGHAMGPRVNGAKEIGWRQYGGTAPNNGCATGAKADTVFLSGADATDTTDVIDLYDFLPATVYGGPTMAAAVPMLRVWLTCDFSAATDSIYYAIDVSVDGCRWEEGASAGNFSLSFLPTLATGLAKTFVLLSDPDEQANTNRVFLAPKIRIRFKGSDQSNFKMAATRVWVSAPTWRE